MSGAPRYDVVIPTIGRPSLRVLLDALDAQPSPSRGAVVVVDDRVHVWHRLDVAMTQCDVKIVAGPARGPAAARNAGIRVTRSPWVVFVDDDVIPTDGWATALERDLAGAPTDVAGVQGRIVVPLPAGRRPTDWERNVAGLAQAQWATADMAYRRRSLEAVGGFDERFPRAYREDADIALRIVATGMRVAQGTRVVHHPVRPAPWHVSVTKQLGNADDALMDRLHGRDWRVRAGAPKGRRPWHLATTAAGIVALGATVARRPRLAALAATAWIGGTLDLVTRRVMPGPRTTEERRAMFVTSVAIPPVASAAWCYGVVRARLLTKPPARQAARVDAVLFDRDGTLVVDVPYNGDPSRVTPVHGAREAVQRLRDAGVAVGVISNQSGVARGLIAERDVHAVNRRVDELVGPFDAFAVCLHGPDDACSCRKPAPGLVHDAAGRLGVDSECCVVIGDIGADVEAARRAGAAGVLVPTPVTRAEEVASAPAVAPDITAAVDLVLRRELRRSR